MSVLALIAGAGLLFLNYLAPLQWLTVLAYAGMAALLFGILLLIIPLRWLGFSRRAMGQRLFVACAALFGASLLWPAGLTRPHVPGKQLDVFLPEYHFGEQHALLVRASPAAVMQALRKVTFDDIGILHTVVTLRHMAHRDFRADRRGFSSLSILDVMAHPRSGFFPLAGTDTEIVLGMAGEPWSRSIRGTFLTPDQFLQWNQPGTVKVAFDFLVEDEGNGWSSLSTETRVLAGDASTSRIMAVCWRLGYPGSGLLQRSMLEAAARRAEGR